MPLLDYALSSVRYDHCAGIASHHIASLSTPQLAVDGRPNPTLLRPSFTIHASHHVSLRPISGTAVLSTLASERANRIS